MKLTKNQREYVKLVRNAFRAVKRRLSKNYKSGAYLPITEENNVLPIGSEKFEPGQVLTMNEILEAMPKRVTKNVLESVRTKNVVSNLEFVSFETGEIITGSNRIKQRERDWKRQERLAKENVNKREYVPRDESYSEFDTASVTIPTSQELVIEKFKDEMKMSGTIGKMVIDIINDLVIKLGSETVGNVLQYIDNDLFWTICERHPRDSDGALSEFRETIIDMIPDEIVDSEMKDVIRYMADDIEEV